MQLKAGCGRVVIRLSILLARASAIQHCNVQVGEASCLLFPVFFFFLDLIWKVYLDESLSRVLVGLFVIVQSLNSSLKTTETC